MRLQKRRIFMPFFTRSVPQVRPVNELWNKSLVLTFHLHQLMNGAMALIQLLIHTESNGLTFGTDRCLRCR